MSRLPTTAAVLDVRGVGVRFGGLVAVDGVDLILHENEVVGMLGANGAGKTTLLNAISGIAPLSGGQIVLKGHAIERRSLAWRARHGIRRTFQRVQLSPELSAVENVMVGLPSVHALISELVRTPGHSHHEAAMRATALEVLERCGLAALAERPVAELSLGQARLVEVARAVASDPAVLLLDEAVSGLSGEARARLWQVVDEVRNRVGTTVLAIEHDVDFLMDRSHRLIVLERGRVLAEGLPDAIRNNPDVQSSYLS